ncbi:hypothetical protein BKA64DRAFT_410643 [Cadophora sp. MPI-SDFR-AT-0126]|nr:hypothetical protein BKA64DRAFT_410643 [Leotiomycetes sp. MPI-SDFR-AT-0126]
MATVLVLLMLMVVVTAAGSKTAARRIRASKLTRRMGRGERISETGDWWFGLLARRIKGQCEEIGREWDGRVAYRGEDWRPDDGWVILEEVEERWRGRHFDDGLAGWFILGGIV